MLHAFTMQFIWRNNWFNWLNLSSDASSSNEAVHLQQRLKSLSSELVTLRNRLHVTQRPSDVTAIDGSTESTAGCKVAIASLITSASNRLASNGQFSSTNVQLMPGSQPKSATDSNNKINSKVCNRIQLKFLLSFEFLIAFLTHPYINCRHLRIAWRKRWTWCRLFHLEIHPYLILYPSMLQAKQMVKYINILFSGN